MSLFNRQMKFQIHLTFVKKLVVIDYQLKLEIDSNKFNQNIINIHLDDMFTTGLKDFREVNKKTTSAVDEALIKNKKTIVQFIIAILLVSKLVDNKEKARLKMH